jgi:hypothetical protein
MKKILCLTDFSDSSEKGILYANELAKKFSSTLMFMHTYKLNLSPEDIRDKLYELCLNFEKEDKYSKVNYEFLVKEGDVARDINEIITEHNIEAVILSSDGEPGIAQKAKCPVIAVPSNYEVGDKFLQNKKTFTS